MLMLQPILFWRASADIQEEGLSTEAYIPTPEGDLSQRVRAILATEGRG